MGLVQWLGGWRSGLSLLEKQKNKATVFCPQDKMPEQKILLTLKAFVSQLNRLAKNSNCFKVLSINSIRLSISRTEQCVALITMSYALYTAQKYIRPKKLE